MKPGFISPLGLVDREGFLSRSRSTCEQVLILTPHSVAVNHSEGNVCFDSAQVLIALICNCLSKQLMQIFAFKYQVGKNEISIQTAVRGAIPLK